MKESCISFYFLLDSETALFETKLKPIIFIYMSTVYNYVSAIVLTNSQIVYKICATICPLHLPLDLVRVKKLA